MEKGERFRKVRFFIDDFLSTIFYRRFFIDEVSESMTAKRGKTVC